MDISAENMILGFNILFFVSILFGFLGGVIKGFRKSIVFLIFSAAFFIIGILVIPLISNFLLDVNISFLNSFIKIEDVEITTIRKTILELLPNLLPEQAGMFVEGTETMAFIFGAIKMVFNLILLIILIFLNGTVLKIFPLIVWLFVKPKKDKETGKKPKKHRLWGGLVGAVKGLVATIMIAVPLGGVTSFGLSSQALLEVLQDQVEEGEMLAYSADESDISDTEDMEAIFEILGSYRKSILGKVYSVRIKGDHIDEFLFDKVFQVKVKTKTSKQNLVIRKDYKHLTNILTIVFEANKDNEGLNLDLLFSITEEDLAKIQKEIKGLSTLNIIKNIAAEFAYDYMVKENLLKDYEDEITLQALKDINLNGEINSIVDVVKVINKAENIDEITENVFALTKDEADEIFQIIGDMKIIQIALPIGINFIFESKMVAEIIAEHNLEDIQKPTKTELTDDFKNIVNIYILAKDIGFTSTSDLTDINEEILLMVDDVHVIELFDIAFNFSFLYKNDELFANVAYNFVEQSLPEEFKDIILRDTLVNNFNASELSSIALLGKLIVEEGMLGEDEIDFVEVLNDNNIDKISRYISGSNILSEATVGIFEMLAGEMMEDVVLETPEDLVFKGEEGKIEIKAIFYSLRSIFELGLLEGDIDYTLLNETTIEKLSGHFSDSKFISSNFKNIIVEMPLDGFSLTVPDDLTFYGVEGKKELKAIFFSAKNILELGILDSGFDYNLLTKVKIEEMAENFSSSKLIAHNLKNIIKDMPLEGFDLEVPEDVEFYGIEGEKELKAILLSMKDISDLGIFDSGFDYALLTEIKVEEMSENFSSSKIIAHNLKNIITDMHLEGFDLEVPEDVEFYGIEGKKELKAVLLSMKDISELGIFDSGFDYALLTEPKVEEMSENFSSSKIISHNLKNIITDMHLEGFDLEVPEEVEFYGVEGKKELKAVLLSMKDISDLGIFDSGFDYALLTEAKVEEISVNFSDSKIIRFNLSPIINDVAEGTSFNFITSDEEPDFWTKDEIYYTFNAVRIFGSGGISQSNIHLVSLAEIDDLARSLTISKAFKNYLDVETKPGGSLVAVLVIPEVSGGIKYESTESEHGELYYLFKALKGMIGNKPLEDFNPTLDEMVEMNVDEIFTSYILEATIVENHIQNFFTDGDFGKYVVNSYEDGENFDWYQNRQLGTTSDTKDFIEALMKLKGLNINYNSMHYDNFITVLTNDPNASQLLNDAILSSKIMNASLPVMLNQIINIDGNLDLDVYPHYKNNDSDLKYWGEDDVNAELFFILDALVSGKDINEFEYDTLNDSNKETFSDMTKAINKSETLRQILPRIIEKSNLSIAESLRTEVDPYDLTEQEWNNEVDILIEIIVKINEYPTLNFESPNPAHLIVIAEIKVIMLDSILYDATKIPF